MKQVSIAALAIVSLATGVLASCQKTETVPARPAAAPAASASAAAPATAYPTRPYFGDTHLHTALSLDAGAAGRA